MGPTVGYIWALVYGLSGVFMIYGMGTLKTKFEAAGCVLFAGGAGTQTIATFFFLGSAPFLTMWSVLSLAVFCAAGVIRARHLIRGEVLVWLVNSSGTSTGDEDD